jgi:uncharacterized protein YcfL
MTHTRQRPWCTGLLAVLLVTISLPVLADKIDSKLEKLGKIESLDIKELKVVNRDGLLHVQATLVNDETENQRLYYRTRWLDQDGFTVWDDEPWKTVVFYGKQKQQLHLVAPTPKAKDFRIELQTPRED